MSDIKGIAGIDVASAVVEVKDGAMLPCVAFIITTDEGQSRMMMPVAVVPDFIDSICATALAALDDPSVNKTTDQKVLSVFLKAFGNRGTDDLH